MNTNTTPPLTKRVVYRCLVIKPNEKGVPRFVCTKASLNRSDVVDVIQAARHFGYLAKLDTRDLRKAA